MKLTITYNAAVSVTIEGTPADVFKEFHEAQAELFKIAEQFGGPTRTAPAPRSNPIAQDGEQVQIVSIVRGEENGKKYVKAKGAPNTPYGRFGLPIWNDTVGREHIDKIAETPAFMIVVLGKDNKPRISEIRQGKAEN